jgi:hypothetical protein
MTKEEERIAEESELKCFEHWIGRLRGKYGDLSERELYDLGVREEAERAEREPELTIQQVMMMADDELADAIREGSYDYPARNLLLSEMERRYDLPDSLVQ